MLKWLKHSGSDGIEEIIGQALRALETGDFARTWYLVSANAEELSQDPAFMSLWSEIVRKAPAPEPTGLERLIEAWAGQPMLTIQLSEVGIRSLEADGFQDLPETRTMAAMLSRALRRCATALKPTDEPRLHGWCLFNLAHALRLAGPAHDAEALATYEALVAAMPGSASRWYNLGLLHKQRGRFTEGLAANRRARELGFSDTGTLWNLGICATGARDGQAACEAWRALGFEVELGDDGLPFMPNLGIVQVRLTTGGMPGADTPDLADPQYEHVWIARLSPCHGRVLSPTALDASADHGDLVLHDGAAIGYRYTDGERVPRFPQLARLQKSGDRCFRFAAIQGEKGEIASLEEALPEGCLVYPHTEQMEWLCRECVRGESQHSHEYRKLESHRRVFGKLVVPAGMELADYYRALQAALSSRPHLRLASPALHQAMGDELGSLRATRAWGEIETAPV